MDEAEAMAVDAGGCGAGGGSRLEGIGGTEMAIQAGGCMCSGSRFAASIETAVYPRHLAGLGRSGLSAWLGPGFIRTTVCCRILVAGRSKGAGWIWVEVAVLRRDPPPGTTCPPLWTTAGKFSGGRREMVGPAGPTRRVGGTSSRMPDALPDLIDHTGPSRPLDIHTSCTLLEKPINNRRLGDRVQPPGFCFAFQSSLRLVSATH